jgi:hypothetical protein
LEDGADAGPGREDGGVEVPHCRSLYGFCLGIARRKCLPQQSWGSRRFEEKKKPVWRRAS